MPLTLHIDDADFKVQPGVMYVVSTPIGNREDITIRSLAVLNQVDIIAAEDTRHTRNLLDFYKISTSLVSCHDFNEANRAVQLIEQMKSGKSIALVSDAGTPLVSDPGHRIVKSAVESGIPVFPVPGPSAMLAAICISGLPTDSFVFNGFPPKKKKSRQDWIDRLKVDLRTQILYESPKRIRTLLQDLEQIMGKRSAVLCREMTKFHEEIIRGPIREILNKLADRERVRGEITLVISGCNDSDSNTAAGFEVNLRELAATKIESLPALAKKLSKQCKISRNDAYDRLRQARKTDDFCQKNEPD